jgi:hypothetical protein
MGFIFPPGLSTCQCETTDPLPEATQVYAVTKLVNNPRNDCPEIILPDGKIGCQ